MTLKDIIEGFDALTQEDFDGDRPQGPETLDALCDAVQALPSPEQAAGAMFAVMERLPAADLGTPGPLVHTLEAMPGYQALLFASFRREPAPLTAWMLNRILNVTRAKGDRDFLLGLLDQATTHPLAGEGTRNTARGFLQHQRAEDHRPAV